MAQNPYVNKVVFGSATLVDLTDTTATADKILQGYGAYGADGAWMDGTAQTSGEDGYVWQDQDGYVHLSDEEGTGIIVNSLTVNGAGTYTAPTQHAYSPVTVPSGSAATPATSVTANPSISVNSSGLITATVSATKSVTPSVSEGWVASGIAGTVTVSGTNTTQLSTQAATAITPTESQQTAVAAGKYTTGAVTVNAIPSTYVGSGIDRRTGSSLYVMADQVLVPSGYYAENTGAIVSSGTEGTPIATKSAVSNSSVTVTPSVTNTAGYISGGTKTGTAVTVSASELVAGTTLVADDSGDWYVADAEILTIPSGTAGTPIATKGAVSNHSVTVTPSVTNSGGWISSGTKTGTAVSVSASELVSGSQTITENGTVDVTNLAEVVVDIDTSPKYTATIGTLGAHRSYIYYDNVRYYLADSSFEFSAGDSCAIEVYGEYGGATIYEDGTQIGTSDSGVRYTYVLPDCDIEITTSGSGSSARVDITKEGSASVTVEPLSVTTNGTYTAPSGTAYSPVTVNVPTGGASNFVTGTFIGTSTGTAMDVSIPYLGNGYPIAIDICVSEGAYNTSGTFYNTIQRYAIPWWAGRKENNDTPNYVGTYSRNCFSCACRYKSSDTDATLTEGTTYPGKATLVNGDATSDRSFCVQMKSATVMSVYIASTSYGFMANIEYTYHIIYSE